MSAVTSPEYDPKYKSVYTYGFLSEYTNVSAEVKLMTLFSSENQNGTGPLEVDKNIMSSKQGYMQATKIIQTI